MVGLRSTILVLGLLVGSVAIPVATAQAVTPEARYENAAFKATNKARTSHDLVDLTHHSCLQKYAVRQAKKMAAQERIFHQSLDVVLNSCHLSHAGENVAYGFASGRSLVEDGWMKSPDHRANILNKNFRLMGLAARRGNDQLWYVSQVFGTKR